MDQAVVVISGDDKMGWGMRRSWCFTAMVSDSGAIGEGG